MSIEARKKIITFKDDKTITTITEEGFFVKISNEKDLADGEYTIFSSYCTDPYCECSSIIVEVNRVDKLKTAVSNDRIKISDVSEVFDVSVHKDISRWKYEIREKKNYNNPVTQQLLNVLKALIKQNGSFTKNMIKKYKKRRKMMVC